MSDVARIAGISRPTLYKYFNNKDALLFEAIDLEALAFAESVAEHGRQFARLDERIIEIIVFTVEQLPRHPYLSMILQDELAQAFRDRAFSDEATLVFAEITAAPLIDCAPALADGGIEISEMMSRFAISMILFPGKYANDSDGLRRLIERRLLPGLIEPR